MKVKTFAEAFIEMVDTLPEDTKMTWDDFFDIVGVSKEQRSDFLIFAILKQAKDIVKERDKPTYFNGEVIAQEYVVDSGDFY